ncbi:hypothetical protein SLEP1_g59292 [Rubroshorea leprosula]|uniref:Uncharacterized protein n=1 Tax=Rubroshorea leprosula TaxID=152421 RepID=A0AAV5MRV8_9ROSI|nr:hypothetical protein SLEP1_g59292 [Rubroshorea leprosula]
MSFEITVSVGGSEEVRALEYGDVSMTTESSDSERTEEGVGRGEVVGVKGDRVPITIVEVEGRREKGYDVDADIVAEMNLNEDEEEEVGKLVRERGKLANIMYLTSAECIEAAELYGLSALSEGVAIPKKLRKKSKTSTKEAGQGGAGKELVPSTSAGVEVVMPRLELKRKGSEEVGALQRKKKVVEEEVRGSKALQFVPRPPPIELEPDLRESEAERAEVRAPGKGKGLIPLLSFQSSLFEAKNTTGVRRFINATFPKVDKHQARDEALRYCGAIVVKHALECVLGEWSSLGIHGECEEAIPLAKAVWPAAEGERRVGKERQRHVRGAGQGGTNSDAARAQEKEIRMMKEAVMELKKNVQLLVHNGMEEHISNFVSSSLFDNIVNFYRLPTAILAFTDCRKKEGVEENGESMSADFHPQIKLRWDCDADRRTVFPPSFDFEFVAMEEEEAEVEETQVGVGVEGAEVDESQPPLQVEVHPVPFDDEQPPLLAKQ